MRPQSEEDEAVNLLSLDGGGVRGVSSLVALDEIMMKIQEIYGLPEIPKPCEFFHMIAGTSTGGLIAIMLGRLRMSTKEALEEYDDCASKIFSSKNKKRWNLSERFRATALQKAVEGLVKKRAMGEGMWDPESHDKGKVIVCVMPSKNIGAPRLVRSFAGEPGVDDQWDRNITIWEAARATTAASSFFKPQKLGSGPTAQEYIDAAIGINNPVEYLLKEAVEEFGSGRRLGCVVSLGTGTRDVELSARNYLIRAPGYYFHLIKTLKSTATDGEEKHRQLRSRFLPFPGAYYRFNVPEAAALVKLNDYKEIPALKTMTAKYLSREEIAKQVQQIAEGLKTDEFDHGLTLGHIYDLDKDQVILSKKTPQSMWVPSGFFTGRQDILEKLDRFFSPRDTGGKPRREVLLHGMGGVGKTEIALKFVEGLENRFGHIFIIDGSSPATILQSYVSIAKQYGLGTGLGTSAAEARRGAAMRWMEQLTEEWFMIFDDCNLSDRRAHLPGKAKGNIIYTSRSTALRDDLPSEFIFEITPFQQADAVELLFKASGSGHTPTDSQDISLAQKIVEELGCLPLAVDKAAASMRHGGWSLNDYLKKLRDQKVRTSSDPRFRDKNVENPTVYAALELSYDAMMVTKRRGGRSGAGRSVTLALKVLNLLCFYHHKDFPVVVVARAARHRRGCNADNAYPLSEILEPPDADMDALLRVKEDGDWNSAFFSEGVFGLQSFSLVKLSPDRRSISMHVLVHTWARQRMERETYLRQCLLARVVILEAIDLSWKFTEKSFTRSLSPHINVCFARERKDPNNDGYEARLLLKLGHHFHSDKRFRDAEDCLSTCLYLSRMEHGNHGWDTINALDYLGSLYHEMGRLGEAEITFWELLERLRERERDCRAPVAEKPREQKLGARSTPSWGSMRSLKFLRNSPLKRFLEGIPENPLEADATANSSEPSSSGAPLPLGTNPPSSSDDLNYVETQIYFAHSRLATVFIDQGRSVMGARWVRDCVTNLEGLVDEDHPQFLGLKIKLKSLTDPGNLEYWEKCVDELLGSTDEKVDFMQSDGVMDLMVSYANCLLKNHRWTEAYNQYSELYHRTFKPIFGREDRKSLELLRRMVDCLVESDRNDEAVKLAKECVARAKRAYGELHLETVVALYKLYEAVFWDRLEYDDECEMILREALVKAEAALGATHTMTTRIQASLRQTQFGQQRVELLPASGDGCHNIDSLWEDSKATLERMKDRFGPNHIFVRRYSRYVGDCPIRTREVQLERLLVSFGPNNSVTKALMRTLEMERTAPGQAVEREGESSSVGVSDGGPFTDPNAARSSGGPARAGEASSREAQSDGTQGDESSNFEEQGGGDEVTEIGTVSKQTRSEVRLVTEPGPTKPGQKEWGWLKDHPIYIIGMY